MSFREFKIAEEMNSPRESHIVRGELVELISPTDNPKAWELINELENGAWAAGMDEGYDHGYQDAVNR
jgi:hypothetical protein